jgi:glycosyltransferase involved in cell wall biosynthesis
VKRPLQLREKLAIVHVTRSPVGGVFRHITDLATAQAEAGHSVGLISDSGSAGALEEERIATLSEHLSLGLTRIRMARSMGPRDLPALISVVRAMAKLRPDVVHCHGAKGGVYGRLAAASERRKGRSVAAFYAPHGGSLHYDSASRSGRNYFTVERALERLTDGLIHVSGYEAETYRRKIGVPRCPAHVVLNGLREEEFKLVAPMPDAADFLMIGELRDLKGVDVFIEAVGKLQDEGFPARAVIVGPGTEEDRQRYRRLADERCAARRLPSFRRCRRAKPSRSPAPSCCLRAPSRCPTSCSRPPAPRCRS